MVEVGMKKQKREWIELIRERRKKMKSGDGVRMIYREIESSLGLFVV